MQPPLRLGSHGQQMISRWRRLYVRTRKLPPDERRVRTATADCAADRRGLALRASPRRVPVRAGLPCAVASRESEHPAAEMAARPQALSALPRTSQLPDPRARRSLRSPVLRPLEQLMRQPLLGWQMVEAGELVADDWRHIWVVPDGNMKLLAANPSARSAGGSLGDACIGV